MSAKTRATIEDLYKVEGKAELVHGKIVLMSPTGGIPGRAGGRSFMPACFSTRDSRALGMRSLTMWGL